MTAFEIENNLCKAREISIAKNCVLLRMFTFKGENGGRGNGEWVGIEDTWNVLLFLGGGRSRRRYEHRHTNRTLKKKTSSGWE